MTTTMEPTSSTSPLVNKLRDRRQADEEIPSLAERKRIRKAAGATRRDIADELGVTYQSVWQWENRPPKRFDSAPAQAYLRLLRELQALAPPAPADQTQE